MPWDPPIETALADLKDEIVEFVLERAEAANEALVRFTPVDTGRLRGNWAAGLNADPPQVRLPDDKTGQITISFNAAKLRQQYQLGQEIVFANFTPYGVFINDGTSKIAPFRIVERAAAEAASV